MNRIRDLYRDGLPKLTEHTISDMDLLLGQIEQIRCGEIATETEESTPQMRCFAVPIRQNGRVDAAIKCFCFRFSAIQMKREYRFVNV